jgi:hypothetical protein
MRESQSAYLKKLIASIRTHKRYYWRERNNLANDDQKKPWFVSWCEEGTATHKRMMKMYLKTAKEYRDKINV